MTTAAVCAHTALGPRDGATGDVGRAGQGVVDQVRGGEKAMMDSGGGPVRNAGAALAADDLETTLALALHGLEADPSDPALLRLAGRASLELGRDDAVAHLSKLVDRSPADASAWLDLGFAHAATGDASAAADAFGTAMDLSPRDPDAILHFAHAAHMAGRTDEVVQALEEACEFPEASPALLRGVVSLARSAGELATALLAAVRLADADPKDPADALDVAELNLQMGRFHEAAVAFARLRHIDDEHEVAACHGQLEALVRAERWREALDVAIDTAKLDRHRLTTDVLSFVAMKLFGEGVDRPHPELSELEAHLAVARDAHRRLHAESRI